MQIEILVKRLDAKIHFLGSQKTFEGCYCGDFLSNVISKAPSGSAWLTVMNNINVAGVALLAEVALIVLCEGVSPADDMLEKCKLNDINVISTKKDVYNAVRAILEK